MKSMTQPQIILDSVFQSEVVPILEQSTRITIALICGSKNANKITLMMIEIS